MTDKQRYQMERWKLLIEDDTRNEMKLKDWLKLRGITKDAYYYWLHKFQRENIDSALQELPAQKTGLISPKCSTVNLNAHKIKSVNDSCINCSYC